MFGSRIALFLFGATIISGHVFRNEIPHRYEKAHSIAPEIIIKAIPSTYTNDISIPQETAPSFPFQAFLPQFLQQGSNLFYKPHFMLSPTHYTPSPVVIEKDCDDKKAPVPPIPEIQTFVIEEPIRIPASPIIVPTPVEETKEIEPIVIPPAPELPPFTAPEFSSDIFEVPMIPEFQPITLPEAPKLPSFPEVPAPIFIEAKPTISENIEVPLVPEFKPVEIPKAPELGSFVMPEIPSQIIMETPSVPCIYETNSASSTLPEVIPEVPKYPEIMEVIESKPIDLPQPPELPPFIMPMIPTIHVNKPVPLPAFPEPEKVEINDCQPIEIPEAPKQPEIEEFKPMDLPQPPELPPFVMPAIPTILIDKIDALPSIYEPEKVVVPELKPTEIPEAPVLPPFDAPQFSVPITVEVLPPSPQILEVIPCPPQNIPPAPTQTEFKPMYIPEAPVFKPFVMPSIPEAILIEVSNNVAEEPRREDETVPETKPPMFLENLPRAPELPPFVMPDIPTIQHIVANETPSQNQPETLEIPEAPVLPPFVAPSYPTPIVWPPAAPKELPCLTENLPPPPIRPTQYIEFKPMSIPEAPLLRPSVMPSIPEALLIEVSNEPEQSFPNEMIPEKKPEVLIESLPPAPVLPPLIMPQIPMIQNIEKDKIVLPSQNHFPAAFPMFCAQAIIIERVLPNLTINEKAAPAGIKVISGEQKFPVYHN